MSHLRAPRIGGDSWVGNAGGARENERKVMNEQTRRIRFPEDRAVGRLMVRIGKDLLDPVPARGVVAVSRSAYVSLTVSPEEGSEQLEGFIPGDLSGLREVAANDLNALIATNLEDSALADISHLTGVTYMNLSGSFTDEGIRQLREFKQLQVLVLKSDDLSGAGLEHLNDMKELRMLSVEASGLTPEGLAILPVLDGLDTLLISTKSFTPELAKSLPLQPNLTTLAILADALDMKALVETPSRFASLKDFQFARPDRQEVEGKRHLYLKLVQTYPNLLINGTWHTKESLVKMTAGEVKVIDTSSKDEAAVPIDVNGSEFDETIAGEMPVLVDFWAEWCGPCKAIAPVIRELASDLAGQVIVAKVDTDANKELLERFEIKGIPYLMLFKSGEVLAVIGSQSKKGILDEIAPALS